MAIGRDEVAVEIDGSLPARVDQDAVGQDDVLLRRIAAEHLPGHADGGLQGCGSHPDPILLNNNQQA
jgi:hypothetical protein